MGNLQTPRIKTSYTISTDLPVVPPTDLICFSRLRWDTLNAELRTILIQWAKEGRRVFFVEEPMFDAGMVACLDVLRREDGVYIAVPHLPFGFAGRASVEMAMQGLLDDLFATKDIGEHALWYFTPTALSWTDHLKPLAMIYNCIDECSAAAEQSAAFRDAETELIARADLVFADEATLSAAKRAEHPQHKGLYAIACGTKASSEQAWARVSLLAENLIDARRKLAFNTGAPGAKDRSLSAGASVV